MKKFVVLINKQEFYCGLKITRIGKSLAYIVVYEKQRNLMI